MEEAIVLLKWTPDEVMDALKELDEVDELLGRASLYNLTELILQYLFMSEPDHENAWEGPESLQCHQRRGLRTRPGMRLDYWRHSHGKLGPKPCKSGLRTILCRHNLRRT